MKARLLVLAILGVSNFAFAGAGDAEFAKQTDILFRSACKNELPSNGSEREVKELKEAAGFMRGLLKSPKETVKQMIERGGSTEGGIFPILMTCALVVELEGRLSQEGCKDTDGSAIESAEAVRVCKDVVDKVTKR